MTSPWMAVGDAGSGYAPLHGRVEADVAVIGGGITGVTTAWLLVEAGLSVVLLEAGRIGAGDTGGSTGNLYGTVSRGLQTLTEKWDVPAVRRAVSLRLEAVDRVQQLIGAHRMECGFERVDQYIGVEGDSEAALSGLQDEFEALEAAGLSPEWCAYGPLPFTTRRMLKIGAQAQFNPFLHARALAAHAARHGARLFEDSRVMDIDASEGLVTTSAGQVHVASIVIATHTPIGFNLVQAEMQPWLEYGISARLASGTMPPGMFWLRDGPVSLRGYRQAGVEHLVVVGEAHETGEGETDGGRLQRLRRYASSHFDIAGFEHAWSAQQFRSADGLPYIGRSAHANVYIATGFAADGLTWGTLAAMLIRDLVLGRDSDAADLLAARRFTPVKSAKGWVQENASVVKHLVGDRLRGAELESLADVPPGQGRMVEIDDRKYAVYRAPEGALCVMSPVCPHLRCHVAWNPEQPGWDCPCHGSRFAPDGRVLHGPALSDLERFPLD